MSWYFLDTIETRTDIGRDTGIYTHTYTDVYTYIIISLYVYTQRESKRETGWLDFTYIYRKRETGFCVCIFIYIYRERERKRATKSITNCLNSGGSYSTRGLSPYALFLTFCCCSCMALGNRTCTRKFHNVSLSWIFITIISYFYSFTKETECITICSEKVFSTYN